MSFHNDQSESSTNLNHRKGKEKENVQTKDNMEMMMEDKHKAPRITRGSAVLI